MQLEISAVKYCLTNFGSKVIPETKEKSFVLMYRDFNKEGLKKQLDYLQAKELMQLDYLQAKKLKELKLEKQRIISMSSKSTSGELGPPSL